VYSNWTRIHFLIGALALLGPIGCNTQPQPNAAAAAKALPEVYVRQPVSKQITDYEEFPGRLEARETILIRARVTGYLLPAPPNKEKEKGTRRYFKEGGLVKEGDLLFKIDPQLYEAQLALAEGNLLEAQGQYDQTKTDWLRVQRLRVPLEVSAEDVNKFRGAFVVAEGKLKAAKANHKVAQVNMSYTTVVAPIGGRIGRAAIDPGNLVRADDTMLTSIGAADPMKATFDLDERTLSRILGLIKEGKLNTGKEDRTDFTGTEVQMWLADEEMDKVTPRKGVIDFTDNTVDPSTGTYRVRGAFSNEDGLLVPGMFVHVRVPIGEAKDRLLIEEKALITDQGQKFVYVVKNKKTENHEGTVEYRVEYRQVTLGRLHEGLRVVEKGLNLNEKVVVSGLQRIRPDVQVNFKEINTDTPLTPVRNEERDPTKPSPKSNAREDSQSSQLRAPPSAATREKGMSKKGKGR
jgi:RND family efflux transporter MFP subunit